MAFDQLNHNLTRDEINQIIDAIGFYYAEAISPDELPKPDPGSLRTVSFFWTNRADFAADIKYLTDIDISTSKGPPLYPLLNRAAKALTGLIGKSPEGNLPEKEKLETFEAEAEKREADRQKAVQEATDSVRKAIAKQQETYAKLTQTKPRVYVKANVPEAPQLSEKSQKLYDSLKIKTVKLPNGEIQTISPSIPNITQEIEKSISPSLQGTLSPEQIHLIALDSAYKAVDSANNPEKYIQMARQSAILNSIAKDNTLLPGIISNSDVLNDVRMGANEIGVFEDLQTKSSRMIWGAFDENLGKKLFADPNDIQVNLSTTPNAGYAEFKPEEMVKGYSEFLSSNLEFFGKLAGLPIDEFKKEILNKALSFFEGQIIKNLPQAASFFTTPGGQLILGSLGIGTAPISLTGSLQTYFVSNPEALSVVNFFSKGYGVTFTTGSPATLGALTPTTGATSEIVGQAGTKLATDAIIESAAPAAGAALGAPAGLAIGQFVIPIPVIGAAIGVAVGWVVEKVGKLIPWQKIKENIIPISAIALLGGLIFRNPFLIAGGGTGLGTGLIFGGPNNIIRSLTNFSLGIGRGFNYLLKSILFSMRTALIVTLVVIPIASIIMILIITNGAYVVPPGLQSINSTNPYISVVKSAVPSGQLPAPTTINYTVTVTAKQDSLTDISIKADCHAQLEGGGTLSCPKEDIPTGSDIPTSINAGTPWTFTFSSDYGNIFQDSLVTDSVTVSATSASGGKVSETGTASICFGKCPLDCFDVNDPSWNQVPDIKSQFIAAASTIAGKYPNFAAKICAGGPVKLCYSTSDPPPGNCGGIYGRDVENGQCNINFNRCASQVGGPQGVLYILAHEATHHVQVISPQYQNMFEEQVPRSEWPLCTYGGNDPAESMAEGDAMYIANPVIYANQCVSVSTFAKVYPYHYKFASNCMYGTDQQCKKP